MVLQKFEDFFGQDNLDVGFAFSEEDKLYNLQARVLCIQGKLADQQQKEKELTWIEKGQTQKNTPFYAVKRYCTAL